MAAVRNKERRAFRWFGSGMFVNSVLVALVVRTTGDSPGWATAVLVAVGAALAVAGEAVARSAVHTGPDGIRVVNGFRARWIPWDAVREFALARSLLRPDAAWVVLESGERLRLHGLESMRGVSIPDPTAVKQIAELNEIAAAIRQQPDRRV